MLFTTGTDRLYEEMMQEIPGFNRVKATSAEKSDALYKYKYSDTACNCCNEYKACKNKICPHIMENLSDLVTDKEFQNAVKTAETCKSTQKKTLLYLKTNMKG